MNHELKKDLGIILVIALAVVGGAYWLTILYPSTFGFKYFEIISILLTLGAFLSRLFIERTRSRKGKSFIQYVMLLTVLRLTLYGVFAFVLIYFADGSIKMDIIYFAIFYFVLTLHEILSVFFSTR